MKKIVLISSIAILASSTAFADGPAKSGLLFEGQLSANVTPKNTFQSVQDNSPYNNVLGSEIDNGGLGGGLYLGYDYALNNNMTIGVLSGYQYIYQLNKLEVNQALGNVSTGNDKLNVNSIPVLATFKYFFNSGWLVGGEGGLDVQKWVVSGNNAYSGESDSNWNVAPMVGAFGGYQWNNGLALTGDLSYVFGKTTDNLESLSKNSALAFYTVGIDLSYKLPM